MDKNVFAARLKYAREALHLTQKELAKKINMSKQTISNWEKAEKYPSVIVLDHVSRVLNVSIDYILGRTDRNSIDISSLDDEDIYFVTALVERLKNKND